MRPIDEVLAEMEAQHVATPVLALTSIIFQCGLRINDARKISPQDILPSGQIVVKQGKGSRTLIVTPLQYGQFWQQYRHQPNNLFQLYSYDFFRRLFIRHGLILVTPAGHNNKVTHAGRTLKAREIFSATHDLATTAAALGHKSERSTTFYLEAEQKKAVERRGLLTTPSGTISNLHVTKKGILYFREYKAKKR